MFPEDIYYLRVRGVFYFKLVIPAKAGIQKHIAGKAGCPPGAGMTVKLPDRSFIIWKVRD